MALDRTTFLIGVVALLFSGFTFSESRKQQYFDPEKLGGSEYCGLCHTELYREWNASAHHFSAFNNPVYRNVISEQIGLDDYEKVNFCSRCHSPLSTLLPFGREREVDLNSWEGNAGITCLSCHRIKNMGEKNGHYELKEPTLNVFFLSENPTAHKLHDTLLEALPVFHRVAMSDDIYQSSSFCAGCHTLEVPKEINGSRDFKLFSEHDAWQNSTYAGSDSKPTSCQDCHMPLIQSSDPAAKDGLIRSHAFAGGNTFLPVMNDDFSHLEKVEAFLRNNRVDLEIIDAENSYDDEGTAGFEITLGITNIGVGHNFPAGTVDSNEAWVSIRIFENESVVGSAGAISPSSALPEDSIRFGAKFLDALGNVTDRSTTTSSAVEMISENLIAPGETKTLKAFIPTGQVPSGTVKVEAVLNWRKYDPNFLNTIFSGRKIPEFPITILDLDTLIIRQK